MSYLRIFMALTRRDLRAFPARAQSKITRLISCRSRSLVGRLVRRAPMCDKSYVVCKDPTLRTYVGGVDLARSIAALLARSGRSTVSTRCLKGSIGD